VARHLGGGLVGINCLAGNIHQRIAETIIRYPYLAGGWHLA